MIDYLEAVLAGFRAGLRGAARAFDGLEEVSAGPEERDAPAWDWPAKSREAGREELAGGRRAGEAPSWRRAPGREPELDPPGRILTPLEEAERREKGPWPEAPSWTERGAEPGSAGAVPGRTSVPLDGQDSPGRAGLPAGLSWERRAAAYPEAAETVGEGWTLGGGSLGLDGPPVGELQWAERADRAFRRDSRRYDGGFYLY